MTVAAEFGSSDPETELAAVRVELERLIERRLSRPLNDDETRQWERLTALEDELLAGLHRSGR